MSVVAWIALGANLGERQGTLDAAVRALDELEGVEVDAVSSWIETEPVGGPLDQPRFLNGVLRCVTNLAPRALLAALQDIERRFGRDRSSEVRCGPRTLDLDLLDYGGQVLNEPDLALPHPRLEERIFVLQPLSELDPEQQLPRCKKSVRERLAELQGQS